MFNIWKEFNYYTDNVEIFSMAFNIKCRWFLDLYHYFI